MVKLMIILVVMLIASNFIWSKVYKALRFKYKTLDQECADLHSTVMALETEYQLAKAQMQRMEETREKVDSIKSTDNALNELSKPSKRKSRSNV